MAVPQFYELFNPILATLRDIGGSASVQELNDHVAERLGLTEKDLNALKPNGQPAFAYRMAWARSYLKAVGLLENSERGVWALTAEGTATKSVDPEAVKRSVRAQYHKRRKQKAAHAEAEPTDGATEEEEWREELLSLLQALNPDQFERLCQRILRESGFTAVEVTGRTGDGGIDGTGLVRLGGLLSFPILFQCKRCQGTIGPGVVRDFRGAMIGRADRGLILTTGVFSRDARREATRDGAPPIDLVDRELLLDKLRELRLGVVIEVVEAVRLDAEWFEKI